MGQATQVEQAYGCTPPTKVNCDLFVMLGTSLMNGYVTTLIGADAEVLAYYFPSGDQTFCQRYGTPAQGFETPQSNKGQFLYMNMAYNYGAGSSRISPDNMMAKELYAHYNWPNPMFFFHYEQNGASLLAGESSPDWTIAGTIYPKMIANLKRAYDILKERGYQPRVSVMWGSAAVTSTTATDYQTAINAIIAGIRTALNDSTIKFLWGKPTIQTGAPQVAYRAGVDLVVAADALVASYDYDYFDVSGDLTHPTTLAMMDISLLFAGFWNEVYYGNTRPTVTNVQVTGTLYSGQQIGFSYSYSDSDSEDVTVTVDARRIRHETGTRAEFYIADDASGTNIGTLNAPRNKGETALIGAPYIGKYVMAIVFPKAQSGSFHGYPVKGSWQGPIIA